MIFKAMGFIPGEAVHITLTSPQGKQTTTQVEANQAGVVLGKILLGATGKVTGEWQLELVGKQQTHRGTLVVRS